MEAKSEEPSAINQIDGKKQDLGNYPKYGFENRILNDDDDKNSNDSSSIQDKIIEQKDESNDQLIDGKRKRRSVTDKRKKSQFHSTKDFDILDPNEKINDDDDDDSIEFYTIQEKPAESSEEKIEKKRKKFQENSSKVMTELFTAIVYHQPEDIVKFINTWSSEKMEGGEITVEITEDLRNYIPKFVFPDNVEKR